MPLSEGIGQMALSFDVLIDLSFEAYLEHLLRKKDMKWLGLIGLATDGASGMYSGERADLVPDSVEHRLSKMGLVEFYYPHNPVHKARLVITDKGRAVLKSNSEAK